MKIKFEVEVEIDEKNISKKYPNYRINYSNDQLGYLAFATAIINELVLNYDKENLNKFGYRVKSNKGKVINDEINS